MRPRRLLWRLLPLLTIITLLALGLVEAYVVRELRRAQDAHVYAMLESQARLVIRQLPRPLGSASASAARADALCKSVAADAHARVTVIAPNGEVLGDSSAAPATMDNHAGRPEVAEALAGTVGRSTRRSYTVHERMVYVAVPIQGRRGAVEGVVRAALPAAQMDSALARLRNHLLLSGLVLGLVVVLTEVLLVRRLVWPLQALRSGIQAFADGDLTTRLPEHPATEIAALAEALNDMAERLDARMRGLVQQRNEREALLSSMVEGVIAVGADGRILTLNPAAAALFGIRLADSRGQTLQEAVRNPAVQDLAARALSSDHMAEAEVTVRTNGEERYLQAHGTVLRGAPGAADAALIVLNDVTHLRQLERMRRDFVANVSHELRTPITTIKGFVETLEDGALDHPEDARRFVGIIRKHADRLAAIIEDLLSLSRLEESGATRVDLQAAPIRPVLASAVEACHPRAVERGVILELACATDVTARVDTALLEQAIVNLIDNAVKYSPMGAKVLVDAQRRGEEVVIGVQDAGCGIASEHLGRIFERFYRVDKARSRELGGTGLGLAIVKHIAQVHGGHVDVESTLGVGSRFSVHLPVVEPPLTE